MSLIAHCQDPEAQPAPRNSLSQREAVTPERAFILSSYRTNDRHGTIISEHKVSTVGGAINIGAGRLIATEQLSAVLNTIGARTGAWVEPTVLYTSTSAIAWHLPAAVRPMHYTVEGKKGKITAPWPDLVLIATGTDLFVFATKDAGRPTRTSELHHAPLMNIGVTGAMCFGNVQRPSLAMEHLPQYEEALLRSRFTHVNHGHTFQGVEGTNQAHLDTWRSLEGQSSFPSALLVPTKITLADFLRA